MNRSEFMEQLAHLLVELPDEERMEAIRYYNDYFDEAGPENEKKVIRELGRPEKVAASIKANVQENDYSETSHNRNQNTSETGNTQWHPNRNTRPALRKPQTSGQWAVLLILLVCAAPILLGIGGGILGGILGLLGGAAGVLFACLAGGLGMAFGGLAILAKGIMNLSTPSAGLVGMGGGLVCIAVGLLLLVLFLWVVFQLIPRLFRTIKNFVSRIMNKRKESAVQ